MASVDASTPRGGLAGVGDRLLGPGAGRDERLRVVVAAAAGALLGALTVDAPAPQLFALAVLTADLCGGIAALLNPAGKRWWHRPGRGAGAHLTFVAFHLIPLALFIWLFRGGDLIRFAVAAGLLFAGAAAVLAAPARRQRVVGLGALLLIMLVLQQTFDVVREAAWFMPLFYAKLLVAYLPVPTEPD